MEGDLVADVFLVPLLLPVLLRRDHGQTKPLCVDYAASVFFDAVGILVLGRRARGTAGDRAAVRDACRLERGAPARGCQEQRRTTPQG